MLNSRNEGICEFHAEGILLRLECVVQDIHIASSAAMKEWPEGLELIFVHIAGSEGERARHLG